MSVNEKNNKRFSSKKFKYGSSAVVFTAVFVVFVILVNVLLSYIDSASGGLYVDMTSKQLYGVGEVSAELLSEIDKPVEIIFCSPRDRIVEEDVLNPIVLLAESYEKTFDGVSVIFKDQLSEKAYFEEFKKTSSDVISNYSIIVNCPSTGLSKIYSWDDMYKYNTEGLLFAFDGEYKLTSAILSTARSDDDMLSAGLVTGHGEDTGHSIRHFLEDYGYEVSVVDLKTVSDEELASYDLLLVCKPVVDFIGMEKSDIEVQEADGAKEPSQEAVRSTTVNEIEKLRDYVTEYSLAGRNKFGNLFIFLDPNYANMPELFSLIQDGFGVRVSNLYPVIDYGTMLNNSSYSADDWRFFGSYSTASGTVGYNMHRGISERGTGSLPAFGVSCLMDIPKSAVGKMEISPVVTASEGAVVHAGSEMSEVPYVPLMTVSKYTELHDSKESAGYAVIGGSGAFLDELESPAFANADLLKNMLSKMGNDNAALDIDFKVLDESTLEVTSADADGMMKKLGIIVPVIIAVIGIAVFIKRKYL